MTGCGLSRHTLTTPSCHWGTHSAPTQLHYRTSCLCHRPKAPVTFNMGVVETIDPAPSPCPSPVPGGYRLPRSSSYSPLQGRAGAELDLGAAAGGVLEGGGTTTERRTPLVDLFCETCSRPWLIGWWDQVGLGMLRKPGCGHLGCFSGLLKLPCMHSQLLVYSVIMNLFLIQQSVSEFFMIRKDTNCYMETNDTEFIILIILKSLFYKYRLVYFITY